MQSYLQEEFLRVYADGHKATAKRIIRRLLNAFNSPELEEKVSEIVLDELRGLYHGGLVVFDGGSSLADHGLIKIVDDDGTSFDGNLHEICYRYFDECA